LIQISTIQDEAKDVNEKKSNIIPALVPLDEEEETPAHKAVIKNDLLNQLLN